jgi:hypothetical protein
MYLLSADSSGLLGHGEACGGQPDFWARERDVLGKSPIAGGNGRAMRTFGMASLSREVTPPLLVSAPLAHFREQGRR